jgi:hypothetical protein
MMALLGLGLTVLANVVALAWGASRISSTVDRLDHTLDKVVESLGAEATRNAVQDQRLDQHERRLGDHDDEFDNLRGGR